MAGAAAVGYLAGRALVKVGEWAWQNRDNIKQRAKQFAHALFRRERVAVAVEAEFAVKASK